MVSPGWRPTAPLLAQAAEQGLPIWGETELAWRLMHPDRVVPWLGITGTNGKSTTTRMTAAALATIDDVATQADGANMDAALGDMPGGFRLP